MQPVVFVLFTTCRFEYDFAIFKRRCSRRKLIEKKKRKKEYFIRNYSEKYNMLESLKADYIQNENQFIIGTIAPTSHMTLFVKLSYFNK